MPSVSLTMIVKNEEQNLEACVSPVRDIVDEIIVVDTGSTDDTREIARRLGARVYELAWCDSFAAARNEAIERATGDYVFVLDADDRVPDEDCARLRDLFSSLQGETAGYSMRSVSLAQDGGIGDEHDQIRLFSRRPSIRYRYRVHEQIAPAIVAAGGELRATDIRVVHTGYRDHGALGAKLERNRRLHALDLADAPTDPFVLFYNAMMLSAQHRDAEAVIAFNLCLPLIHPVSDMAQRALARITLARCLRELGEIDEAFETIHRARDVMDTPALACTEADLLIERGALPTARVCLASALSDEGDASPAWVRASTLLAEVLLALGEPATAEERAKLVVEKRTAYGATAPIKEDGLFRALTNCTLAISSVQTPYNTSDVLPKTILANNPQAPLGTWVRWQLANSTATGTWDITMRIYASANRVLKSTRRS